MHNNDEQHDGDEMTRLTEFIMHAHDHGRETTFVGDSQTALAIEQLGEEVRDGFQVLHSRIDHLAGKHDFSYVEGCPSCESKKGSNR